MTDDGKVDWEEIQAMTPEQLDAELREAGADPVAVGDMGRAAAFLGKMVRFGWPGQMQHRELQALLAEVRQDERQRRERATDPTKEATVKEIVEWLLGLEGGLERVIRGEVPSGTSERRDMQARRGVYEGIADDIKRKWGSR